MRIVARMNTALATMMRRGGSPRLISLVCVSEWMRAMTYLERLALSHRCVFKNVPSTLEKDEEI
jgi:hypothetical protein